jgi:hypothetical protein
MLLPDLNQYPHLAEVTPSVLAALGAAGFSNTLDIPEVNSACVLLIDGLGWELLNEHATDAPVLSSLDNRPLRVGFPSTTAAGLAATGIGLQSGEHGMVGYSFEMPGVGVLSALRWCLHNEGTDLRGVLAAEEIQPLDSVFVRAEKAGVKASVVSGVDYPDSLLSRTTQRGACYSGVHALGDLAAGVLNSLRDKRSFCWAYHADLDKVGHWHEPGSLAWRLQLRQVDRLVESIVEQMPQGSMLAVVADHGMVALDETAIDLDKTAELRGGVRAFGGEPRARHLYLENGAESAVVDTWRDLVGDKAWIRTREEAIDEGWFGSRVSDHIRSRIGDVVVAAQGGFGLIRSEFEPIESRFIGHHGSFSSAEQLVPLAVAY